MGHIREADNFGSYKPCAVYYEESDSLEYVRTDVPSVYRRVDDFLTLVVAMNDRSTIGFKLKGFRNFYFHHLDHRDQKPDDFLELVEIVEEALGAIGDKLFDDSKRMAYQRAIDIAQHDKVKVHDLPHVING